MKTTMITRAAMAAFLLGSAGAAIAEPGQWAGKNKTQQDGGDATAPGHGKAGFLATYDLNGDGKVSVDEFKAERKKGFDTRDADGNGTLTENEYVDEYAARLDADLAETRQRQMRQAHVRFDVLDGDKDKSMTLDEFHASGSRIFEKLDTNGDGVVDEADTAESY